MEVFYMKEALKLSKKALKCGEVPVGAIIVQNNKQIQKLRTADTKIECWINADYLKYFTSPIIKIVSPVDPVFVYEFGFLAGIIMPVRMPKQN